MPEKCLHTLLTSPMMKTFQGVETLRSLTFEHAPSFSDTDAEVLHQLYLAGNELDELKIPSACISDDGLLMIGKSCASLRVVDISYCQKVSSEGISLFCRRLGKCFLEELSLDGCFVLSDTSLWQLRKFKNMRNLSLAECSLLSDEGITSTLQNFNLLESLDLSWVHNLGNISLYCLSQMSHLEELCVAGCFRIGDAELSLLCSPLARCRSLRTLDLGSCSSLTEAGIGGIASSVFARTLRELEVSDTAAGDTCAATLFKTCQQIECLDLSECEHITSALVSTIQEMYSVSNGEGVAEPKDSDSLPLPPLFLDLSYCPRIMPTTNFCVDQPHSSRLVVCQC